MGIDLYCNNKSFFTSYPGWNEIRLNIIKATFQYIQKKFVEDIDINKHKYEDYDYDEESNIIQLKRNPLNRVVQLFGSNNRLDLTSGFDLNSDMSKRKQLISCDSSISYSDEEGLFVDYNAFKSEQYDDKV